MALQEVALKVTFAGGVSTKEDPKSVPTVRLLALENAVFTRAVSLSKRYGYTSLGLAVLGSPTPYALPRGLAARGDELVLFTEDGPYSYVEGAASWAPIADGCQSIRQSDRALVKTTSSQTGCDSAVCRGIRLTCWLDSRDGVWFSLGDASDGAVTIAPTQASSTGTNCRAVRCGAKLALLWAEAAQGEVNIIMFDPAEPHTFDSAQYPRALVDDLVVAAPYFDAVYVPASDDNDEAAAIVWHSTAGALRIGWLVPSGVIGSVGIGWCGPELIGTPSITCVAIAIDNTIPAQWALAWATATDTYVATVYSKPATQPSIPVDVVLIPTATGIASGIDRIAAGCRAADGLLSIDVWAEDRNAVVRDSIVYHRVVSSAGAVTTPQPAAFRGACLASSAWTDTPDGGTPRGFVHLLHSVPLFSSYFAVRDDGLCVAQSIPTNAGEPPGAMLPRVTDPEGARAYEWAAVYRNRVVITAQFEGFEGDFSEAGPRLVTLDFDASDAYQSAFVGRTLYLGGAAPMAYDGVGFVEAAPMYAPDWELGEEIHTAGSGGGLATGTFSYVFWYEWVLANGEIVRGPVSKPYSVTVAGGGSDDRITFGVPTLRLSAWGRSGGAREDCRVGVARSLVGDASVYYRISSLDPSTEGTDNGYVTNDQDADAVAFVDVYPDSIVETREPLYTTGGIPSNDPTPTSGVIAAAGGRLFVGDPSNPDALYFSQERADAYAIEMTPELRIVVPPGGGPVTGVGDMDGAKIIFKRGSIYILTGAGPLPNPEAGGEWSTPALITSDVGCVDQRSIVTTPIGLMFQSAKGIYIIDRGRNVSYVGAPVEAYNALPIVRATLIEDANQVRFLTATTTLLYDYLFGQWSTFTNHGGLDAVNASGLYHYLRTDGRVFRQSTAYADDNLQIPMVIETAWIRFGEARQGLQRIWHAQILGTWLSAHRLLVQVQTDYDVPGNWSEPIPAAGFDATDMGGGDYGDGNYGDGNYGGDSPAPYQFTLHVGKKCQSIRFRFTFVEAVGEFGACVELTELLLTGGVKGNRNKIPEARMG